MITTYTCIVYSLYLLKIIKSTKIIIFIYYLVYSKTLQTGKIIDFQIASNKLLGGG